MCAAEELVVIYVCLIGFVFKEMWKESFRNRDVTGALRLLAVGRKYAQNLKDKYREEEASSHADTDDSVRAKCLVRWAVCVRATELHVCATELHIYIYIHTHTHAHTRAHTHTHTHRFAGPRGDHVIEAAVFWREGAAAIERRVSVRP